MPSSRRTPSNCRQCWHCNTVVMWKELDNIQQVDRRARECGWRYVTEGESWRAGRMVCPNCKQFYPHPSDQLRISFPS